MYIDEFYGKISIGFWENSFSNYTTLNIICTDIFNLFPGENEQYNYNLKKHHRLYSITHSFQKEKRM